MKKILVVENERPQAQPAFDAANDFVLNGEYKIEWVSKSQDIHKPYSQYSAIFVDLSLAESSNTDGFGVIDDIIKNEPMMSEKVAIITGNSLIKEQKEEKGIDNIAVFIKPLSYRQIADFITKASSL